MSDLLRPDLWALVRPALAPARAAGLEYIASGRFYEKTDSRKYRESATGWPMVRAETFSMFTDGPPRWGSLFSLKAGELSKIVVDDIPELAAAVAGACDIASRDQEFAERLGHLGLTDDAERRDFDISWSIISIIGQILGRAEALGLESEHELEDLYRQVERGHFAGHLDGDIMVPLVLTNFEVEESFHLADEYWLEPMSEAVHRARALHDDYRDVSPLIAGAATHAVIRRDVSFVNPAGPLNVSGSPYDSSDTLAFVHHVLEAIHIVTGKKSGYAQVLVASDAWVSWRGWSGELPHLWNASTMQGYPDDFQNGWNREKEPISNAELGDIRTVLVALTASPKNVQLAARRCLRTTFRSDIEDEILDATIGIEALLSQDRDELTHRMSLRAAAVLADTYRPDAIYNIVKQVYGQRSQIVHGGTPKNSMVRFEKTEFWAHHMAVFLLRALLESYLSGNRWTPASLDALIVQRLGRADEASRADSDPSSIN